jgi:hypothetical protein
LKRQKLSIKIPSNAIFLGGKTEGTLALLEGKLTKGETVIYVCQNKSCQRPTTDVEEAMKQLKKPYTNIHLKINTKAYLVAKLAKDYICFQKSF